MLLQRKISDVFGCDLRVQGVDLLQVDSVISGLKERLDKSVQMGKRGEPGSYERYRIRQELDSLRRDIGLLPN
jgi:hypothetical protein